MIRDIILYGEARKLFGKKYRLDVESPAEAIKALSMMVDGFREWLLKNKDEKFVVTVNGKSIEESMLTARGEGDITIRVASIRARKGGGAFGIIAGLALLAFTWWNPFTWAYKTQLALYAVGAGLVLSGAAMMLSPQLKPSDDKDDGKLKSHTFGIQQNSGQGDPVPVVYGEILAKPVVISSGISTITTIGISS